MNRIQLETKEKKTNLKTHSYIEYNETELDEWFRKSCVYRADHTIENIALYNDYMEYCKKTKTFPVTLREFTKEMPVVVAINWRRRLIKGRNAKGTIYRGLCLQSNKEAFETPHN